MGSPEKYSSTRFGDPLPISYEVFSYQRYMENNTHKDEFQTSWKMEPQKVYTK